MYKKSSRRSGGSNSSGWDHKRVRHGGGMTIQTHGAPAIQLPEARPGARLPSGGQLRLAYIISTRLGVAVPAVCLENRPAMSVFLDHYSPKLPPKEV